MSIKSRVAFALFLSISCARSYNAQTNRQSSTNQQTQAIIVRSNLVFVPVLVKNKAGETIFSLTADDFVLTDDGVPQPLQLESDNGSQPLALAVIVQTGCLGASHLRDYGHLGTVLDAVIGDVPHRVAVISFDTAPRLELDFTTQTDAVANKIATLHGGDGGAAILDALKFGINLLRN
jgi:hypothetical protein